MSNAQTTTEDYRSGLIYRAQTADLVIEVVDTATTRAMHFGTSARQSCMWLHDPQQLQLSYTRAMMGFLLLLPQPPRRVLLLGLGGGSIAKFLLHNFPDCEVHGIERSGEVIDAARRFFALPETERLHVHEACAEDFMYRAAIPGHYDAVLVDAFDAAGAARCVARQPFIVQCKRALCEDGVLGVNLWRGRGTGYRETLRAMARAFEQTPLRLPVRHRGNLIAFASRNRGIWHSPRQLESRARTYQSQLRMDFSGYLRQLRQSRHSWLRWLRT